MGRGAGAVHGGRARSSRAVRSLTPWHLTWIGSTAVAVICLIHLQFVLQDSVYVSRFAILARGMGDVLPYFLLIGSPIVFAAGVAELTRDRGWVSIATRAHLRSFFGRILLTAFLRGGTGALLTAALILAGSYVISFEPGIHYVSSAGPSFAPDLSVANERHEIGTSGPVS